MSTRLVRSPRSFTDESRRAKNEKISATRKTTKERRTRQTPQVVDCKIQHNKLSATQREALTRVFLEAKWLYNECLASDDVFSYVPGPTVTVKTPDGPEIREYARLGSQMKQSVVAGVQSSIRSLAALKHNGRRVGKLHFISQYRSIDLKQAGTTYAVRGSKIRVQNIPGWMKVTGVRQLQGREIANAKLVSRADGYHILITTYRFTDDIPSPVIHHGQAIGVDMGVKTALTLSTGEKIDFVAGETERLKRLQRTLSRRTKDSNNYRKVQHQITREYMRIVNRRDDFANKLAHNLLTCETVVIQDENIRGWRHTRGYVKGGRKIQAGVLGRVKSRLKNHPRVIVIPRFAATTATCVCGHRTPHPPGVTVFTCSSCGYTADRDEHGATNMLRFAGKIDEAIPPGQRDFKPVEIDTAATSSTRSAKGKCRSMKQEAARSLVAR